MRPTVELGPIIWPAFLAPRYGWRHRIHKRLQAQGRHISRKRLRKMARQNPGLQTYLMDIRKAMVEDSFKS